MKGLYIFSWLLIGININCSNKFSCNEFEKNYQDIIHESEGDTLVLLNYLNSFISKEANCNKAYLKKGDLLFHLDNLPLSAEQFRIVIARDSTNTVALFKLGQILQYQEKYDSSIFFLKQAIYTKINPDGAIVNYHKTEGIYDEYSAGDIDYYQIALSLGESYYFNRELSKAESLFDDCFKNKFNIDEVSFYLGLVKLESMKKDSACYYFNIAKKEGYSEAFRFVEKYCIGKSPISW